MPPFDSDDNPDNPHFDERVRLSRDLIQAARTMGDEEARYLVDAYYQTQENRKRTDNQTRSLDTEPHFLIGFFAEKNRILEQQIGRALDAYTQTHPMGDWMRNVTGIGPVLSAGLLAHIYMGPWCSICKAHSAALCQERQAAEAKKAKAKQRWLIPHSFVSVDSCPTVGHIWAFAGYAADGQKPWEKGKIRPYNSTFKVICWKIGQSFMKLHNNPNCFYGHIYQQRKEYEIRNNESGRLAEAAAKQLPHFNKATESYKWYAQGKLPPAHIDARARRYAVKIFLSHLHSEWHQVAFGRPAPAPFPIAHLGHTHYIPPRPAAAE